MEITFYKISCKDPEITEVYVGSTNNYENRKMLHKYYCDRNVMSFHRFINDHGGWENWEMSVLEQRECVDVKSLRVFERGWVKLFKAVYTSGMTWEEDNYIFKEEAERKKRKERLSSKITCECGIEHRIDGKLRHLKSKKHQDYITTKSL